MILFDDVIMYWPRSMGAYAVTQPRRAIASYVCHHLFRYAEHITKGDVCWVPIVENIRNQWQQDVVMIPVFAQKP